MEDEKHQQQQQQAPQLQATQSQEWQLARQASQLQSQLKSQADGKGNERASDNRVSGDNNSDNRASGDNTTITNKLSSSGGYPAGLAPPVQVHPYRANIQDAGAPHVQTYVKQPAYDTRSLNSDRGDGCCSHPSDWMCCCFGTTCCLCLY